MALKAWASSPISSVRLAYSVNRVSNSPRANLLAALLMLFKGSMIRWTATEHSRMETSRTAAAVNGGQQFAKLRYLIDDESQQFHRRASK